LLLTFADFTKSLMLIPGSGGQFEVAVNSELVFSKKTQGRYPEIGELNEAVKRFLG
jgi:selenoprotein W-related protein